MKIILLAVCLSVLLSSAPYVPELLGPRTASAGTMLVGADVHAKLPSTPASLQFVAATINTAGLKGRGIVRMDFMMDTTTPASVIYNYDLANALGLQVILALVESVPSINDPNVYARYLTTLVPAMGARHPFAIELGNEPNRPVQSPSTPWIPAIYAQALYAGHQAAGPLAYSITMAGLSQNDKPYLTALGDMRWTSAYSNEHLYTSGMPNGVQIGPLAPNDPDTAHNGKMSFLDGVQQAPRITGKALIVGEFGEEAGVFPTDAQRQAYFVNSVVDAKQNGVAALLAEEVGPGGGMSVNANLQGTCTPTNTSSPSCATWLAFLAAAR